MSTMKGDISDKVNIIDRKTFENIQQIQSNVNNKNERLLKIRNAKFRKKNAAKITSGGGLVFDLMQFLTKTPKQKQKEKKQSKSYRLSIYEHRTSGDKSHKKKRGKTREFGKRKKLTKLKKYILRHREKKREERGNIAATKINNGNCSAESVEEMVDQVSTWMFDVTIDEDGKPESDKTNKKNLGIAKTVHSRRFRSYCDNCTTPLLAQLTEQLLRELDRFQKRAHSQNAIKASAHRRFVVGFREAQSFLNIKKVKLVIIAPDCEVCGGEEGLDARISSIKNQCKQQNVPYLFSLRRRQLAYALFKKAPVGCVAVLDYDGAREIYLKLIEAQEEARKLYEELTR